MANQVASDIYSRIFRLLAEDPDKYGGLAAKIGEMAQAHDFAANQMDCWPEAMHKLGLCTRCCRPDARVITFLHHAGGGAWSFSLCNECVDDKVKDMGSNWRVVSNAHEELCGTRYEDRLRMDKATAIRFLTMHAGAAIMHLLDNEDGTFSLLTHIVCEHCDYCIEQGDCRGKEDAVALPAKEDPYEKYGDGRSG